MPLTVRDAAPARREFLLLGAAIFLVYGVLFWAPLISDDQVYIVRSASVAGPWTGFRSLLSAGPNAEAPQRLQPPERRLWRRLGQGTMIDLPTTLRSASESNAERQSSSAYSL